MEIIEQVCCASTKIWPITNFSSQRNPFPCTASSPIGGTMKTARNLVLLLRKDCSIIVKVDLQELTMFCLGKNGKTALVMLSKISQSSIHYSINGVNRIRLCKLDGQVNKEGSWFEIGKNKTGTCIINSSAYVLMGIGNHFSFFDSSSSF